MKKITIDDFASLKSLSQLKFSPGSKNVCFVSSQADVKKNGYNCYINQLTREGVKQLTTGGQERSFIFLDDDTILFPADRGEKNEKSAITSKYYKLSLNGGEAQLALNFNVKASAIVPAGNGNYFVLGTVYPGFEDMYKDEKLMAAYLKSRKENEDYEIIEHNPWWFNGDTFNRGKYSMLFFYNGKKKSLKAISPLNTNVSNLKISKDKTKLLYSTVDMSPAFVNPRVVELWCMDVNSLESKLMYKSEEDFRIRDYFWGDSFVLVVCADSKLGINTDPDFYKLDMESGQLSLYCKWGHSIGSSVGSDVRYGGGTSAKMDGDDFYFISTEFDGGYLNVLKDGKVSRITQKEGSCDSFDVNKGHLLLIGLYDMNAQEIYNRDLKKMTNINGAALKGKYVAQPQICNAENLGHQVHGFVLPPVNYDPAKKYPCILDIHGGPKTVFGPVFYHEMQYWANQGYFVAYCNPTGSDGRGDFMELRGIYGTVDYTDIMAFCDKVLESYPAIDKDHFYETGGSYGGYMTNWIIGHTNRFKACASQRSISNWTSFQGVSDIGIVFGEDQCGGNVWNNFDAVWEASPLKHADKAVTPTLFIHSFEDYRCPIDQGYQMYTALVRNGVESKMVLFKGENHELSRSGKPKHRIKRLDEITQWFENHK